MLVGRKELQALNQMKEALTTAVMKEVGDKIVAASNLQQKQHKQEIIKRIQEFEKSMRTTAREIVKEELKLKNESN